MLPQRHARIARASSLSDMHLHAGRVMVSRQNRPSKVLDKVKGPGLSCPSRRRGALFPLQVLDIVGQFLQALWSQGLELVHNLFQLHHFAFPSLQESKPLSPGAG